jgi:hypothetical protein
MPDKVRALNKGGKMSLESEALKLGGVPEGWDEIDIEFYRFSKFGDKVVGVLLLKKPITMGKGNMTQKYHVRLDDGKKVSFLGSIQLDEKLSNVVPGTLVWIEYIGDIPVEGTTNTMKQFKVFTRKQK